LYSTSRKEVGERRIEMSVTAKEVIQFFKSTDLELAELVLEFGSKEVSERVAKRQAVSANLKKARAARKPKVEASAPEAEAEVTNAVPQEAVRRGPGRPRVVHSEVAETANTVSA
jgi:hypothetical protein